MDNLTNCPQCPKHCPVEALSCGRGRAYFGQSSENQQPEGHDEHSYGGYEEGRHGEHGLHGKPNMDSLEGLLRFFGHALHHGGVEDNAFAALSADEQEQLKGLLKKLAESWNH